VRLQVARVIETSSSGVTSARPRRAATAARSRAEHPASPSASPRFAASSESTDRHVGERLLADDAFDDGGLAEVRFDRENERLLH